MAAQVQAKSLFWNSNFRLAADCDLTYSRWTSSLPSCLWSQRIFPSLPGSRLTLFYRDASSALLQLVNQWLNFTYSRSHAFRTKERTQILLGKNRTHDFRTSRCAGYLLVHSGDSTQLLGVLWARPYGISANVGDKSPFEMRFDTVPQSPIPILTSGYVKTKCQNKLRPKALPCFSIGSSANRPRNTYEVLLNSGSVVHSRNVTWARLPPSVPVSAENVRSVSVSRKGGKFDSSYHE